MGVDLIYQPLVFVIKNVVRTEDWIIWR